MKKDEKVSERKKEFRTTVGGTVVNRVYTPADSEGLKEGDISLPGEYPAASICHHFLSISPVLAV